MVSRVPGGFSFYFQYAFPKVSRISELNAKIETNDSKDA
jgi:hypothetical protein